MHHERIAERSSSLEQERSAILACCIYKLPRRNVSKIAFVTFGFLRIHCTV